MNRLIRAGAGTVAAGAALALAFPPVGPDPPNLGDHADVVAFRPGDEGVTAGRNLGIERGQLEPSIRAAKLGLVLPLGPPMRNRVRARAVALEARLN